MFDKSPNQKMLVTIQVFYVRSLVVGDPNLGLTRLFAKRIRHEPWLKEDYPGRLPGA